MIFLMSIVGGALHSMLLLLLPFILLLIVSRRRFISTKKRPRRAFGYRVNLGANIVSSLRCHIHRCTLIQCEFVHGVTADHSKGSLTILAVGQNLDNLTDPHPTHWHLINGDQNV